MSHDVSIADEDFKLAASGAVDACIHAGFPADILVPLRPWNRPGKDGKADAGKAPATPDPGFPSGSGPWINLHGWQRGDFCRDRLIAAGRAGANAGVLCGQPSFNLAAVDLDPAKGHEAEWPLILEAVALALQGDGCWVRHSRPGSHAVLARITDQQPGRKTVFHVRKRDAYLGKVELLGGGTQIAAAGRHHTDVPIHWSPFSDPAIRRAAPPIEQLPELSSFDALTQRIELALRWLVDSGVTFERRLAAPSAGTPEELASRIPDTLTADDLIALCDGMPNGAAVDRDTYITVALNLAACCQAIDARGPAVATAVDRVGCAFASWAARWEGPRAGSYADEFEKWHNDLAGRGDHGSWPRLLTLATRIGGDVRRFLERDADWINGYWRRVREWQAAEDFAAEPLPAAPAGADLTDRLLAQAEAASAAPPHQPVRWAKGFVFQDGALWREVKAKDGKTELSWICQAFTVDGEASDPTGADHSVVVSWAAKGKRVQVIVPRRLCHESGGAVASLLADRGLSCSTSIDGHGFLRTFVSSVRTDRHIVLVNRCGWHRTEAGLAFTVPTGAGYGPAAGDVLLQHGHECKPHAFQQAGTLVEWQDQIGRYAVGNSRMALMIAAAFVAPLLDIAHEESGGLHLCGESRSGKTTLLATAASVYGRGVNGAGQIGSWRSTLNGLEAASAAASDLPQYLDELGQVDARALGSMVYAFSNQAGKARANQKGAARAAYSWRTVIISTGELTVAAKLAEAGQKPTAGMDARLLDVPASAGAGLGVFETLHGFESSAALVEHLRHESARVYGSAGAAFLARLAEHRSQDEAGLRESLVNVRREFIRRFAPAGASAQVTSVAGRFGMIAAAGELAIEYGILPWPKGEALKAARVGFAAWLGQRGTDGAMEDFRALEQVRAVLAADGEARFTPIGGGFPVKDEDGEVRETGWVDERIRTANRLGYRRVVPGADGNQVEFLIFPARWKDTVCRGFDPVRVAKLLLEKGHLVPGEKASSGQTLRRNVRIPGHGVTRFYCLRDGILSQDDEEA